MNGPMTLERSLAERVVAGDRVALARLISWAEDDDPRFRAELDKLWPRVGRAWRIGVTGPPGAGKSTLVDEITRLRRDAGKTVGVVAVDPTSPFTGGALLGDRIRMEDRTLDPGVFIRSMASRGGRGGLARASASACDVLDAFGFDEILLETVGVGQAEYDVLDAADTVVVVLCPGGGDSIQAMKAGLLEVADVIVVNKADLPGADRLLADMTEAVHVRFLQRSWKVPVVAASAGKRFGVEALLEAVDAHRAHVERSGLAELRRAKQLRQVRHEVGDALDLSLWGSSGWSERAAAELERGGSPHAVAARLLSDILARLGAPAEVRR
jgi:LAO/AO transport system kinase